MNRSNLLIKSISIILGVSIMSKIAAFLTEAVLAAYLGTSLKADAYSMVMGIQHIFYPMLSVGIWNVFLPVYKQQLITNGCEYADNMANKMLTLFIGAAILMTALMFAFADIIVKLIAPGFNETIKALCIEMVRISSPQYIFIIIAAFYAAMLQSHGKFFESQIREVVTHIPLILTAIFFYRIGGVRVLAAGLVAGSAVRLFVLLPFLSWGYRFKFGFGFKDNNIILMLKRIPSALITAGVTQLNTLIDKIMASNLQAGAVSSLSYGQRLINVLSGTITTAVGTALYPAIAELITKEDQDGLKSIIIQTIYIISAIIIPVSISCIVFSKNIVSVVFERGAFDSHSVTSTAGVFLFYSPGMIFSGLKDILSNIYYCYGDTKTTMRISIISILMNIVLNIVFAKFLGISGLALATSVSAAAGTSLLFVSLRKYIKLGVADIYLEISKITAISIVAFGFAHYGVGMFRVRQEIIHMLLVVCTGITTYLAGLKLSGAESLKLVIRFIMRHI